MLNSRYAGSDGRHHGAAFLMLQIVVSPRRLPQAETSNSRYERHAIVWPLQIAIGIGIGIAIGIASLPNSCDFDSDSDSDFDADGHI